MGGGAVLTTGVVIWMTGRPASGKSTLARAVHTRLVALGTATKLLDGDEVRASLMPSLGYGDDDRDVFYARLARLAAKLARQGYAVLVPATAHKDAYRRYARSLAPRFVEVYVNAPSEVCARRDIKHLYSGVTAGRISELPGVDVCYENPRTPDVVADGGRDEDAVRAVVAAAVNDPRRPADHRSAR